MARSWELTEDQKKEFDEKHLEISAKFDPETGRRKGETENTGDNEDVEGVESRNGRERVDEDENIR